MIFVDEARIFVQGGNGGKGCESFYKDQYSQYPKPNGGDGGKGGNIILMASRSIQTLLDFRYKQHYKAPKGTHASSNNKTGRNGKDCILRVPVGTIIRDYDDRLMIKDLLEDGQSVVVAKGGSGGFGNGIHKRSTEPQSGQERTIHLELKLVADVGIVGFPNAGKSTFISAISKVRSPIANYPFTTKSPILGMVHLEIEDFKERRFVIADLPGIIEGAHMGRGLGHRFLRHAERTKILLQMVDMSGAEGRDPLEDYEKINHEIGEYGDKLIFKNKIVAANKMDLPQAEENLKRFRDKYKEEIWAISSQEKEGLDELVQHLSDVVCKENSQEESNA